MPKEISHWTLAQKAFQAHCENSFPRQVIAGHPHLYYLGAILPDIPFYTLSFRSDHRLRDLANQWHDNRGSCLAPVIRLLSQYDTVAPPPVLALLSGVISHLCADMIFHPFVYYYSGIDNLIRHFRLESFLDVYYYSRLAPSERWELSRLWDGVEMDFPGILEVMRRLFDPDGRVDLVEIKQAINDHCRIQPRFSKDGFRRLFRILALLPVDKCKEVYALYYPSLKSPGAPRFSRVFNYRHPLTGSDCTDSIATLEARYIERCVEIQQKLYFSLGVEAVPALKEDMIRGLVEVEGNNLSTGVLGRLKREMVYFDTAEAIDTLVR